ncbi:hypothetical protein A9Q84_07605 [Halobacteriovorax marinus]|uniref:Secreted protein n=1 Tax=Halobacteriovorax marinus TaxID=97084 RepID=A0A1Y5F663_9BACT|nr:hypothetical protein A9Q84_07605 [Halobacteriovorax marinus]
MKLLKLLSIVALMASSTMATQASERSVTHLNQVRNSLWVFGVDNGLTTEVELVGQGIEGLHGVMENSGAEQSLLEVPEELGMAMNKFES